MPRVSVPATSTLAAVVEETGAGSAHAGYCISDNLSIKTRCLNPSRVNTRETMVTDRT